MLLAVMHSIPLTTTDVIRSPVPPEIHVDVEPAWIGHGSISLQTAVDLDVFTRCFKCFFALGSVLNELR